jgi:hypothetical protein
MRKSCYRDYATDAFRFWAREGGSKKYKDRVWNEALKRQQERETSATTGISKPTESAVMKAEAELDKHLAELADLEAVEFAMAALEALMGYAAVKALKIVYMTAPDLDIKRGDIHARVHAAELSIPASERSIYYWLTKARTLFAEKRGLRLR